MIDKRVLEYVWNLDDYSKQKLFKYFDFNENELVNLLNLSLKIEDMFVINRNPHSWGLSSFVHGIVNQCHAVCLDGSLCTKRGRNGCCNAHKAQLKNLKANCA